MLATYNGETYLEEQLNSLINQTYPNFDIIAVDDCSTDGTFAILNRYAQQNPNFTVYLNDTNLGFIKNFEKGCGLATGELIAPCDQDDFWESNKLTLLAEAIGDYPLIYHDSWLCGEDLQKTGKKISDIVVCKTTSSCLEYAVFARIYGHTLLFTKTLFNNAGRFMDVIPHDWWLAYNATLHGGIKFLPVPLVSYRQHAKNVFGIIGNKSKKNALINPGAVTVVADKPVEAPRKKYTEKEKVRIRINKFYEICPAALAKEKKILGKLVKYYSSFSLVNNFGRMFLFFRYWQFFLALKKQSLLHKYLFCFKIFIKIK